MLVATDSFHIKGDVDMDMLSGKSYRSKLPKQIAIIGTICLLALTALALLYESPVAAGVGVCFSISFIYDNFLRKDPLVEAFYRIVGGKSNFDNLPLYQHSGKKNLFSEHLRNTTYNKEEHRIQRALTEDGRHVMILKCDSGFKDLFIFVEKLNTIESRDPAKSSFLDELCRYARIVGSIFLGNIFHTRPAGGFSSSGNLPPQWISSTIPESWVTQIQLQLQQDNG